MGEYAKRKSDGVEIKIGTCESMYYIRFEDRHAVSHLEGNTDVSCHPEDNRFRLPFPDEDSVPIGQYDPYNRSQKLYRVIEDARGNEHTEWFEDALDEETKASMLAQPMTMQLHHAASGLLLNVPCYHGIKLPEVGAGSSAFWNGKNPSNIELSSLRVVLENEELAIYPVVRCVHCNNAWRESWEEVLPYVPDVTLRERLKVYAGQLQKVA